MSGNVVCSLFLTRGASFVSQGKCMLLYLITRFVIGSPGTAMNSELVRWSGTGAAFHEMNYRYAAAATVTYTYSTSITKQYR